MLDISRSEVNAMDKQPLLSWLPLLNQGQKSASFVCGRGHDGILLDHEINADGLVSPSVVCNGVPEGDDCDFHDHIKLVGWEG